jgi:hypothetical protein
MGFPLVARHGRACPGHPRFVGGYCKDVDATRNSGLPELRNVKLNHCKSGEPDLQ